MKQPIAVNISVLKELAKDYSGTNKKSERQIHKFFEFFENFHVMAVDKYSDHSCWLNDYKELLKDIDPNLKKIYDDLCFRNDSLKKQSIPIDKTDNYIYSVAHKLPDRILINDNETLNYDDLHIYGIKTFISNEYEYDCVLYRIPKHHNFKAGICLKDLSFLLPYLRNYKKVDIIDKHLLKPDYTKSFPFISSLFKILNNGSVVRFYFEKNLVSMIEYKKLQKELLNLKTGIELLEPITYNNKNHLRYIIAGNEKPDIFTIEMDCSFNNFENNKNCLQVKKPCNFHFFNRRTYQD